MPPRVASAFTSPVAADSLLQDLVRLLGGQADMVEVFEFIPVAVRRLAEGAVLIHEGAPLRCLHIVRSGSLKSVRTCEDGYEQVTALALPGDVLGFDGLHSGRHAATEVALELSTVYALPLSSLRALKTQCPALDDLWQQSLSRQLARAGAAADMLTAVAADVRLARFLLWMSARADELGWSSRRLRLSMCRRDLASLLGVAHETVSRSFTTMADAGLLKVDNRDIEILDIAQLRARALITRRPVEAASIFVPKPSAEAAPAARPMADRRVDPRPDQAHPWRTEP